ncbi:MAG: SDR family NAD(P)-dependent oxidoreductase [Actinomycetes bacterium]
MPEPTRVLVTGAGTGIGRATALRYAERGARLTLVGRRAAPLDDVATRCREQGADDVLVRPADVTDAGACEKVVADVVAAHGGLDVCVHSAAVAAYGRLHELPLEAVDRVVEINVLGSLRVARPVLRAFREQQGGTLVLIGSVLGRVAVPQMGAYVVSKWAVRGLARVLALESRDIPGVEVCLVAPGAVDTPIYPEAGNWTGRRPRPPWPVAQADDVARAVLHTVEHPRRERLTGWATPLMAAGGALLPWAYDALAGPLMRVGGFSRAPAEPGPGNLWRDDRGQ